MTFFFICMFLISRGLEKAHEFPLLPYSGFAKNAHCPIINEILLFTFAPKLFTTFRCHRKVFPSGAGLCLEWTQVKDQYFHCVPSLHQSFVPSHLVPHACFHRN